MACMRIAGIARRVSFLQVCRSKQRVDPMSTELPIDLMHDDGRVDDAGEIAAARRFDCVGGEFTGREYPQSSTAPVLPTLIADDLLEYYGYIFCRGGFRDLKMTFEQFLLVIDLVRSSGLQIANKHYSGKELRIVG